MSTRVISSPGKFVVGKDEISKMGEYVKSFGKKALLVAHVDDANRVNDSLEKVEAAGVDIVRAGFGGECTYAEIERIKKIAENLAVDVVIGLGGGKAIDTAKCIAIFSEKPLIVVPTIASTDAPCSSLAVVYSEEHVMIDCYFFTRNPNIVLVDSQIIAQAPVRYLSAGIGDAYATYFEARACRRSGANNFVGGVSTEAAFALATLCHEILIRDGEKAIAACRQKAVTQALENIIETNLLLSGIGFESVGLAAAHSIHDALTILPDVHNAVHGEKVAIGVLAQHILENESNEQIIETLKYFKKVGLPTKLSDIGLTENVDEKLRKVAEAAIKPGSVMHNLPFNVTADMVFSALQCVDSLEILLE